MAAIASEAIPKAPHGTETKGEWLAWGDPLRLLGALAVVAVHVSGYGVVRYGELDAASWWLCNLVDSACQWCVPVFVMLSGALLLHAGREEPPAAFLRKRFLRVGLPLLFWVPFYLLWGRVYQGLQYSFRSMVKAVAFGMENYHLHYLFTIAGLYLLTPALHVFCRHAPKDLQAAAVGLALALGAGDALVRTYWHASASAFLRFVPFLGYYLAGHYLRSGSASPRSRCLLAGRLAASVLLEAAGTALLVARFGPGDMGLFLYDPLSPTTMAMSLCLFPLAVWGLGRGQASRTIRVLAGASLGVYLIHPAVLDVLARYGLSVPQIGAWLGIPLTTTVAVAASLAITLAVQQIPGVRRILG